MVIASINITLRIITLQNNIKMNSTTSKTISIIRFSLICGVVFIHSQYNIISESFIQTFLGEMVGRIAVPLFFCISGFLFFYKYTNNIEVYKSKIKKRIKSLLIPYFLWNTIAFLIYTLIYRTMEWGQFFSSYLAVEGKGGTSPADGPLWFIRNLFFVSLFSPIIYSIITNKIVKLLIPLFILFWILHLPFTQTGIYIAFTFFSLGGTFNYIKMPFKVTIYTVLLTLVIYVTFCIIDFFLENNNCKIIFHNTNILLGMFLFWIIHQKAINTSIENKLKYLSDRSFFIFCSHEILLYSIKLFISEHITINSFTYIITAFITITISIIIYNLINCFSPKISAYLNGNR